MKKFYSAFQIYLLSIAVHAQVVNLEWAKSVGDTANEVVQSMTLDAMGNVYLTGLYRGTVDFDPGAATSNLTSKGLRDIYIQKLDSNGNFVWTKSIGGTSYDDGNSISVDASGNVYITGAFKDTVDFNPGTATFNLISTGQPDAFILKLDGSGNFIWAKSIGETTTVSGRSITTDAVGNVYVTGHFQYTADFDPGSASFYMTSIGGSDVFILKLSANGNFIWAKSIGGFLTDFALSITTDAPGNVYITGYYQVSVDFNPGSATFNLTSKGGSDIFIEKLTANGNFAWARSMGGTSFDESYSIATDDSGNVFITGKFQDTADFDPGTATFNLISSGSRDIYIQKLDSNGNFKWAKSIGGTSFDAGIALTTDPSGNIYTTGEYRDTVDFDPGTAIFNLTSIGQSDIFVQKLDGSGNFIWAESVGGPLRDQGRSIAVDASGNVYLTGVFNGIADFDPGTGAFNLTSNGSDDIFILKLNQSSTVGIEKNTVLNSVSIYPNPNEGIVNIDLGNLKEVSVKVFSSRGQLIYYQENIPTAIYQFELNAVPGFYIIELSAQGEKKQYKLVKK